MATIRLPSASDSGAVILVDTTLITGYGDATAAELAQLGVSRAQRVERAAGNLFTSYTRQELETAIDAGNAGDIPGRVIACADFTSAGALVAGGFGFSGGVKNAAGDYTVTFNPALPAGCIVLVTPSSDASMANKDGPPGATQNVKTWDAAGVAADAGFTVLVIDASV